jgi:uncharacterized protein with HEPN domain
MYVDDDTRLRHMLDAAREAVEFARGRSRADLDADRMLMHSLVRCLEIIGEAASKVTAERRAAEPEIPWRKIVGLRNQVIHNYVNVRLDVVWDTVEDDLPPLVARLQSSLPPWNAG